MAERQIRRQGELEMISPPVIIRHVYDPVARAILVAAFAAELEGVNNDKSTQASHEGRSEAEAAAHAEASR